MISSSIIAVLCAAAAVISIISMLIYRRHIIKTFDKLNEMADSLMGGTFSESVFNESRLSAVESKFAHYLLFSQVSSKNVAAQHDKIKELITDISHQTKTPIANILLYSEMLMENTQSDENRQNLEALHQQAEKLNFLIASLVKLSRLETGIVSVNADTNNVKKLVMEVCEQYKPLAEQKGLYLYFSEPDDDKSYMAEFDEKWTAEAIGNIVDNAIKYTDNGGITVSIRRYEMFCCIEIADTGIGISEEETALIFKRFYRSQSVNKIQGIGVGLYLAREIVSAENGYIKVMPQSGGGTKFCVYLPWYRKNK